MQGRDGHKQNWQAPASGSGRWLPLRRLPLGRAIQLLGLLAFLYAGVHFWPDCLKWLEQLQQARARSRAAAALQLPAARTCIGRAWHWRRFDNPGSWKPSGYGWFNQESGFRDSDADDEPEWTIEFMNGFRELDPGRGWSDPGITAYSELCWMYRYEGNLDLWDANGDGKREIIEQHYIDSTQPPVRRFLDAATCLPIAGQSPFHADNLEPVDVDGDGQDELAILRYSESDNSTGFSFLHTDGSLAGQCSVPGRTYQMIAADPDGDGIEEILTATGDGKLYSIGTGQAPLLRKEPFTAYSDDIAIPFGASTDVCWLVWKSQSHRLADETARLAAMSPAAAAKAVRLQDCRSELLDNGYCSECGFDDIGNAFRRGHYRKEMQMTAQQRLWLRSELQVLDGKSGRMTELVFPEKYLAHNLGSQDPGQVQFARLPGEERQLIVMVPEYSGGLLVMAPDGNCVHYEELGQIPDCWTVLPGREHDWIVLILPDRTLVYP